MPFDGIPQDYETKPDVFSVEGLIAWLETQPGETTYCYGDTGDCLWHRYFAACGLAVFAVGGTEVALEGGVRHRLPDQRHLNGDVDLDVALSHPRTYSAALQRARSLLSSTAE